MLQRNDYDFRNQRKILVLEMFEILGAQTLTKILLHCVIIIIDHIFGKKAHLIRIQKLLQRLYFSEQ